VFISELAVHDEMNFQNFPRWMSPSDHDEVQRDYEELHRLAIILERYNLPKEMEENSNGRPHPVEDAGIAK